MPESSPSLPTRGRQLPSKLVVPRYVTTDADACHALNAAGGLVMLEWQDGIMDGWLGRDARGKWSAPTCGGTLPRQNGKSLGLVESRANYGMLALGEKVLYTSHLQKTSTETFEDMANFFDTRQFRKYLQAIKTALGREEIRFKNGGRIKFLARTRNGGRGQHGDLLIFDEALELDEESQSSFLPAISASPNPQTIYISTPPTAKSIGSILRNIRSRALSGESEKTAWFEWGVDEIGDVSDKSRWYETNPSLGVLIQESTVESEFEQMDEDTFARERLGWWSEVDTKTIEPVIRKSEWDACAIDDPVKTDDVVYAVKFSADGSTGSIAACHKSADRYPFVYVVDSRQMGHGVGWIIDRLSPVAGGAAQIIVDGKSHDKVTISRLRDAGVHKKVFMEPDIVAACSSLLDAVQGRRVTHFGQPALDASATRTERRRIGSQGGWGFETNEDEGADASLIEAVALAYWGAMTTKRKPGRKAVVRI